MKLTKKLEKEIRKVYDAYWDGYMKGDTDQFSAILDEDVKVIGSTEGEVFFNKQEALSFYLPTADQIAGKAELRNRIITIETAGNLVLVTEQNDFYILIEDNWTYYAKGRLSTFFHKRDGDWKIIQQHGSMPDIRAAEGEQFALKKISKENLELRDAVKRRTVELEQKNRELEIEASLERVRTVAMGMNQADDMLDVCRIISAQMGLLSSADIRNVQTAIFYPEKMIYRNYEYYRRHEKSMVTDVDYTTDKRSSTFSAKMQSGAGEFFTDGLSGKAVQDWYEFQKTTAQFPDFYLETATSLTYYWFSLGPVALGCSSYKPLTEEEISLFKRFRNVFELAYRRFLDIQQAVAQAREAQIEAALEKIRAVAMGMRKQEELIAICEAMYKELLELGFSNIRNAQIAIKHGEKQAYLICAYSVYEQVVMKEAPYTSSPLVMDLYKRLEESKDAFYQGEFSGKKFEEWREWRLGLNQMIDPREFSTDSMWFYLYSIGTGHLGISTFNAITDEQVEIVKRFKNVFELSYQRYVDIANAEAQARESQIQLALERVRARTMAMQKSDELAEAASLLFQQVKSLGIQTFSSGYTVWDNDEKDLVSWMCNADGSMNPPFIMPVHEHPLHVRMHESWKTDDAFFVEDMSGETMQEYYRYLRSFPLLDEAFKKSVAAGYAIPERQVHNMAHFAHGNLLFITYEAHPEFHDIFIRFANVFDQTYTRFLDLQKAEAQTTEAQIELGLERVRARAMAMQKSDELKELIGTVFTELIKLDFVLTRCVIMIYDPVTKDSTWWMANSEAPSDPIGLIVQYHKLPPYLAYLKAWQERNAKWQYSLEGKIKVEWDEYLFSQTGLSKLPDFVIQGMKAPDKVILSSSFNNFGNLTLASLAPLSEEHFDIMLRFAKVFDLTYTRFNDLQKAEAQAKESQIQLALERVRARTMAMQKSDELRECVLIIYEQLQNLDFDSNACNIIIIDKESGDTEYWVSGFTQKIFPEGYHVPYLHHPYHENLLTAYRENKKYAVMEYSGEMKKSFDEIFFTQTDFRNVPEQAKQFIIGLKSQTLSTAFFTYGALQVLGPEALSDDKAGILQRFGIVFEQTYTRFLDLQKAEAQAREAKIEASLERVRSKAMAMHNSQDLADTIGVFYRELQSFSITPRRCGVGLLDGEERIGEMFTWNTTEQGESLELVGRLKLEGHPTLNNIYESWIAQTEYHPVLRGKEIADYYSVIRPQMHFPDYTNDDIQYGYFFFFKEGGVYAWTEKEMKEDELQIYRRFTSVLSLTYKRYRDLQQAEGNARESQIQLALERVRARTMAMQKSAELADAAVVLFQQFAALGEVPDRISIGLVDKQTDTTDVWATDQAGTQINIRFKARNDERTTIEKMMQAWQAGEKSIIIDLQGEDLKNWIVYLRTELGMSINDENFHGRRLHNVSFFSQGWLNITTMEPLPAETLNLLDRFAAVFNLTYTRFNDLQIAEAQTKKAKIETALERVRARALAMQQPEELKEVAEVLRHEMGLLGVEELETCSIYINDEQTEKAECWYALKDSASTEKKLVNDHFALNLNDTWVGKEMLQFYNTAAKQTSIVMKGEQRKEWIRYCEENSAPFRGYYGEVIPDRTYHLYKFSHGAIGAAAAGEISNESWDLLQRAASVFSLGYSRFKDLTQAGIDLLRLKEEKQRAEDALSELQVTQKQLIQSEKMASLGELTAGIAHEIQNPLNFVNNFSEVSTELLDEMILELDKGNPADVIAIADDLKQNLEKILHHGKRADGIVKGMLQHSRSSSGAKEPTNITVLADEYLRLAYHGLRAKDKSFNAVLKTNYDEAIGDINIIPQDIGRAVLNLITNAFYAVAEKKKQNGKEYEPTVSVSTTRMGENVELTVMDNGNGIAPKVLEKIFQPFFTTKPTGQGTGLGLSLSYDIVKAHGGELKVETAEGEGSVFIIQLPIKNNP